MYQWIVNKLVSLINTTRQKYAHTKVSFSPIIPKYNNNNIDECDRINNIMIKYCKFNGVVSFIETYNLFVNRHGIRFERLSKFDNLHLNRDGIKIKLNQSVL